MNSDELRIQIEKYIEAGYIEEANQLIQQYKKLIGNNDEIASIEAILNIYMGEYDRGLEYIQEGLKFNINNSDLYFTMGNIYEIKKDYDRAYLCYEKALFHNIKKENETIILNAIENIKTNYKINVKNYSIVILTYNQLEYTKVCINSIRNYNDNDNYEIIIVDNNSTDGTAEWIKKQEGIKYILNEENKGFPAGCNQGIKIAEKGNDIFLLNNDTVIMPNSIFNLRMGLYSNEKVGATGAVSNSISYYQQINQQYNDFDEYMDFALKNNIPKESSYEERIKLVGFAMFIKRKVLDKVGLLDERFTPGNYEDDDISLRMIAEGYKLLLCRDAYIHHFGSVSFKRGSKKHRELLRINSNKFREKWGFISEVSNDIRYDIVNLINERNDKDLKILEIGCASGATLLAIKHRYPNSKLYGVELNENCAKLAGNFAEVYSLDIENNKLNYEEEYFDYIIFSDVLEGFYNPQKVLENMKKYLKPKGHILVSVSNIMHHSVIRQLINGSWTYEENGIIRNNNIRFFTKREIIKLLNNLGFKDIKLSALQGYTISEDDDFIKQISQAALHKNEEEFYTYKYLLKVKNSKIISEEIIRKFKYLIRRIEFDIDIEETEEELIEFVEKSMISYDDIIEIIEKNSIDKVFVLNYIAIKCYENGFLEEVLPLLNRAYELSPQDLNTSYNIAYVLNTIGEKSLAIQFLNKLNTTNEEIEKLKNIIGGSL